MNEAFLQNPEVGTRLLQVASTFTSTPISRSLQPFIVNKGIAEELSFAQYAQMAEYMLGTAADSERIVGTLVLVRVEDLLRDVLKSSTVDPTPDTANAVREALRVHVEEFLTHVAALSRRGKPIGFLACPSTGWIAGRYKIETLCRTYTNLLTARVRNFPQVTMIAWPASLLAQDFNDRSADRLGQVPFTRDAFDQLGRCLGEQIESTLVGRPVGDSAAPSPRSPDLAEYVAGLRVHVRLSIAKPEDRSHVDRILRTAAAFSLQGEKREMSESEVDGLLKSDGCILVAVSDRLSNYGFSGVIAFRAASESLLVDALALSCPVLGKQVEYAVVSGLARIAAEHQCANLVFNYRRSGRNQMMFAFLKSVTDRESDAGYVLPVSRAQHKVEEAAVAAGTWTLEFAP